MNEIVSHEREPRLAHDPREYLRHVARARELQAQAISHAFVAAGRFLARGGSELCLGITGALRKRRTLAELSRLDDHMLADIGISRTQIPMIAQGLIAPSGESPRRIIPTAPCPPEYHGDAANETRTTPAAA